MMTDSKLDLILTKLESMESELTSVRNEQQEMKSELQEMKGQQRETKYELQEVKGQQQEMKKDILEIKRTQTDISKKSDIIIEQVVKNADDITLIKDNQQVIANIIERQEDTINVLSRRSIDHEAEIKRIK